MNNQVVSRPTLEELKKCIKEYESERVKGFDGSIFGYKTIGDIVYDDETERYYQMVVCIKIDEA